MKIVFFNQLKIFIEIKIFSHLLNKGYFMPDKKDESLDYDYFDYKEHSYEDDDDDADREEALNNPKS